MTELKRKGLTVYVDDVPTLHLAHPIMTRPQDWALRARSILWPQLIERAAQQAPVQTGRLRH